MKDFIHMLVSQNPELVALADELYEKSGDDDERLAKLMRELPEDTAIELCTSNLTNSLQAYIYAFNTVPDIELYDKLLLQSSVMIKKGIIIDSVETTDIIFIFNKEQKKFVISLREDGKIIKEFSGENAYELAKEYAINNIKY